MQGCSLWLSRVISLRSLSLRLHTYEEAGVLACWSHAGVKLVRQELRQHKPHGKANIQGVTQYIVTAPIMAIDRSEWVW